MHSLSTPRTSRRPARGRSIAGSVLALSLLASACSGTPDTPSPRPSSSPTVDPARFDDYVALGDSYTAGPLIPRIRLDPLGCLRSTADYPAFLAAYVGATRYTDMSCSGARIADLTRPQKTFTGNNPAQADALDEDTDLVTIGIGGNDRSLFGDLIEACAALRDSDSNGSPCRDRYTVDGVDTKSRDAAAVRRPLTRALRLVHRRAPNAMVVVVGYPRLLPGTGTCPDVPFATGDYRWGDAVEQALDASLRSAAAAAGARYVDAYAGSLDHDACAGADAWVNGNEIRPLRAYPFHPFAAGMRGVAALVYAALTGDAAPDRRPMDSGAATLTPKAQRDLVERVQRYGATS